MLEIQNSLIFIFFMLLYLLIYHAVEEEKKLGDSVSPSIIFPVRYK
jgi:hypothetical protein